LPTLGGVGFDFVTCLVFYEAFTGVAFAPFFAGDFLGDLVGDLVVDFFGVAFLLFFFLFCS
jgi:hypothetical protein